MRHWTYELATLPAGVHAFEHYPPIYLAEALEYGLVGWPLPDDERPPPHPLHDEFRTRLKHRTLILATLLKQPSQRAFWPAAIQNLLDFIRACVLLPSHAHAQDCLGALRALLRPIAPHLELYLDLAPGKPLGFGCRVKPPS